MMAAPDRALRRMKMQTLKNMMAEVDTVMEATKGAWKARLNDAVGQSRWDYAAHCIDMLKQLETAHSLCAADATDAG